MVKRISFCLVIFCVVSLTYAQQVNNITAKQQEKKIIISYDLTGKQGISEYEIKLYVSTNGGSTWEQVYGGLSGAIGAKQTSGMCKTITWDVLASRDKLRGDNIKFKVTATYNESGNYTESASGVNIDMVFVIGGTFTMGSPSFEKDRNDNETQHSVTLSDYYLGKYEVTVGQFKKFIDDNTYITDAEKEGWSWGWSGSAWENKKGVTWKCDVSGNIRSTSEYDHPVINISWNDAKAYCEWLSSKTGKKYSLPTEAQWEYACRAGTTAPFNAGNCLSSTQANYNGNYPYASCSKGDYKGKTLPVDSYAPNAWGLYNMHGNVWEWCADYCNYETGKGVITDTYKSGVKDPVCKTGSSRVLRSGSWINGAKNCRSANRAGDSHVNRNSYSGFRLVCIP